MNLRYRSLFLFLGVLLVFSVFYFQGVASVPFHPDETTYIYMSVELKPLLSNPARLFWQEKPTDGRQDFRLLNPPLLHYAIQIGRTAAGLPAMQENWNWSVPWEENQQEGKIPTPQLLLAARLAAAGLVPVGLLFYYLAIRRAAGEPAAWVSFLLLAANALFLLHTRRAMAEGIMVFTMLLALWSIVSLDQHRWLCAVPIALAFCAKQSLVPLVGIGMLAVLWQPYEERNWKHLARQAVLYGASFLLVVYLLNPVAWKQPVQTTLVAVHMRQYLVDVQVKGFPEHQLKTPVEKLSSFVHHVYFAQPMFAEESSHIPNIQPEINRYMANPMHALFRSAAWGGLLLALTLAGLVMGIYHIFQASMETRRRMVLLLLATFLQAGVLLVMIPLSWQRYYLPVIPFACLWTGYATVGSIKLAASALTRRMRPASPVVQ